MTTNNTTLVQVNEKQSRAAKQLNEESSGSTEVIQNNLARHAIQVHKFGGSSLATAECVERAIDIIKENCQ